MSETVEIRLQGWGKEISEPNLGCTRKESEEGRKKKLGGVVHGHRAAGSARDSKTREQKRFEAQKPRAALCTDGPDTVYQLSLSRVNKGKGRWF